MRCEQKGIRRNNTIKNYMKKRHGDERNHRESKEKKRNRELQANVNLGEKE